MRTRRFAELIFANIGLILAGFVVLELLFGSWIGNRDPDVLLTKPRGIVDAGGLYDDPSGTVVVYSRDEYGLRGPYHDISEIDVLTIGVSTTDQRYITDGRTWQDALSQAGVEAGHALQVANASVDGQTTYGHIKSFESWFSAIPDLRPSVVRQTDGALFSARLARVTLARMSDAFFVQMNGLGASLC